MDCPGGLHTEKGGGERGAFFDQREEDILVGQCWKKQEMGGICPHRGPAPGAAESRND